MITLEVVKDIFKQVSLAHKDIQEFYVGDEFSVAVSPKTAYPIVFLEIPYNINYSEDRKFKSYSFNLLVLLKIEQDDIVDSHRSISAAEDIGDAILSKIQNDYKQVNNKAGLILSGINNALSVDQFSNDYLAGVRYPITVTVTRDYSTPACYADKFECAEC